MTIRLSLQNLCVVNTLQPISFLSTNTYHPLEMISLQRTRPITEHIKNFLLDCCIHFTLDNFYSFIFLRSLSFFFNQFNGAVSSIKNQISKDFQSLFVSMIDAFLSCKDIQSFIGQGQKMDTIMEDSLAHGQPPLLYIENQYGPQKQDFFTYFFHILSTLSRTPLYNGNYFEDPVGSTIESFYCIIVNQCIFGQQYHNK